MIKFSASVLILCGCVASGLYFASEQSKKALLIREIIRMLSVVESKLRYVCMPVPDLLRILTDEESFNHLGFIRDCRNAVENGESFPEAWERCLKSDGELCKRLGTTKNAFLSLGNDIGATDIDSQLSCCEYYKQIFAEELAVQEENSKKYSKLYPALGLTLGISALIIMV